MKVGVLSDTHGRFDRVRDALSLFDSAGVEAVFHCGDVGGIEVLEQFVGRRFWFVWGNMDLPEPAWRTALHSWGLPWPEEAPARSPHGGGRSPPRGGRAGRMNSWLQPRKGGSSCIASICFRPDFSRFWPSS